jgi:hypothetical protein
METSHLPAYDYRPGEGPTLVFLHSWGGAARTWQPVIERLPGRGTLAVEARGWGRSRSLPGLYTCGSSPRTRTTSSPTPGSASTSWWAIPWAEGGPARRRHAPGRAHRARARRARPAAAVTPEYRQALAKACETDETTAAARDTVLTATPLTEELKAQIVADSPRSRRTARSAPGQPGALLGKRRLPDHPPQRPPGAVGSTGRTRGDPPSGRIGRIEADDHAITHDSCGPASSDCGKCVGTASIRVPKILL